MLQTCYFNNTLVSKTFFKNNSPSSCLYQKNTYFCIPKKREDAQVAKLVDALCSGRSVRKDVLVRIQSWAPRNPALRAGFLHFRRQAGQNSASLNEKI